MNRLLTLSGTELARMIREGKITSLEAVETHIRRIESVNPVLNAVVADRFEDARKEARAADKRLRSKKPGKLPPYFGVPCTIKECFRFTGMPNTSGLVSRKGVVADGDATAVDRLRKAGAIPLGVTNVPELCMWMETHNRIYGRTNNPYDPSRIVGGSSGGEGAIIGAGGSPFGLGSDIGGSVRMPAFFNGVFGHKPTGSLVPNTGQHPIAHGDALGYLTTGLLARRAEDLWPLLCILAGPDGADTVCKPWTLGDPKAVKISDLRVLNVEDNGTTPVSDDLREAQSKCVTALAHAGAKVTSAKFPALKSSFMIWSSMISRAGGPAYVDLLRAGKDLNLGAEFVKSALRRSDYTLPSLALSLIEKLGKNKTLMERYARAGKVLRRQLVEKISPNGVMLYPSYSSPAPPHLVPLLHPFHWVYTAIVNVMELPATQVPLGLNRQGLPLGVQVISTHGNDHLSIAVALHLEYAFGGWRPPRNLGDWD